jgi:hypothetical protein
MKHIPPCPESDWDNLALTCETDPAFEASEHPKIKYVWQDDPQDKRPLGVNLDKWNYPELVRRWEGNHEIFTA